MFIVCVLLLRYIFSIWYESRCDFSKWKFYTLKFLKCKKKTSYDVLFLWLDLFFWIQIIWSFRFNKYKCFFIGMLFIFVTVTNLLQDVKDWYVGCWYYYKILWLICKSVKIRIFLYFYVLIIGRNWFEFVLIWVVKVGKSIDFSGFERYLVRYLIFGDEVEKVWIFRGFLKCFKIKLVCGWTSYTWRSKKDDPFQFLPPPHP